jgi:hypothetical protein
MSGCPDRRSFAFRTFSWIIVSYFVNFHHARLVSDKRFVLGLLRRQWVLDHKFADVVGPCGVSPSHMYLSAVACIVIPSLQPSDPGRGVSSRNIGPFSLAIRLSADRDSAPVGFVSALRAAPLLPFTFVLSLIASFFAPRRAAIVPVIEVGENAWTLTTVHDTSPQPPPLTAPTIASPRYT